VKVQGMSGTIRSRMFCFIWR